MSDENSKPVVEDAQQARRSTQHLEEQMNSKHAQKEGLEQKAENLVLKESNKPNESNDPKASFSKTKQLQQHVTSTPLKHMTSGKSSM